MGRQEASLVNREVPVEGFSSEGDICVTPLLEGSRWPPPGYHGNQRPVTSMAKGGGGGSRYEKGLPTLRSGSKMGTKKGGGAHPLPWEREAPTGAVARGPPQAVPQPPPHVKCCVFPVASGDEATVPAGRRAACDFTLGWFIT